MITLTTTHLKTVSRRLLLSGDKNVMDLVSHDVDQYQLWLRRKKIEQGEPVVFVHEGKKVLIIYNKKDDARISI